MSASEPDGRIAVPAGWPMATHGSTRQREICALAHVSGGFEAGQAVKYRPGLRQEKMGKTAGNLTDFNRYLVELTGSDTPASGRPVVAYFDLDRTLIAGYSITALALTKMWSGSLSPRRIIAHAAIFLHWGLGRSDYHQLLEATARELVGMSEAEMEELGQLAFERRIRPMIYSEARRLIDAHVSLGHEPVIVTSATRYQAEPIARDLGVEQMYCTELAVEDGRVTGEATPCYGHGKKQAAERHIRLRQADMADAYFYSDSCEDLPLLQEVGRPVAVNAKPSLARIAAVRNPGSGATLVPCGLSPGDRPLYLADAERTQGLHCPGRVRARLPGSPCRHHCRRTARLDVSSDQSQRQDTGYRGPCQRAEPHGIRRHPALPGGDP